MLSSLSPATKKPSVRGPLGWRLVTGVGSPATCGSSASGVQVWPTSCRNGRPSAMPPMPPCACIQRNPCWQRQPSAAPLQCCRKCCDAAAAAPTTQGSTPDSSGCAVQAACRPSMAPARPSAPAAHLGCVLGFVVGLLAHQEGLAAAAGVHVLNADVDPLLDVAPVDLLERLHAHRALGHVPHAASLAVVELVGHALHPGAVQVGRSGLGGCCTPRQRGASAAQLAPLRALLSAAAAAAGLVPAVA